MPKTIVDLLKTEICARVSISGTRWMVWDDDAWVVYEYNRRKSTVLYSGPDEEAAVAAMVKE